MVRLTCDNTSTALAIGDDRVGDAELGGRQGGITKTDLAIGQLAKGASFTSRGSQLETAAVTATHEGVGASHEGSDGNGALHSGD